MRALALAALVATLGAASAAAQDVPPLDPTVPTDTLVARAAPADVLAAYRADPDFQYDQPSAAAPSLWAVFLSWFARTVIEPLFGQTTPSFWRWSIALTAVVLIGWAVSLLLRSERTGVFSRRDVAPGAPLLDVDDIESVDLDVLWREALARGAHREAVRLRFLLVLQRAADAGALQWRRDKTNRDYALEVRAHDPALAGPFGEAARVFDYVWYGERPVDARRYRALEPLFDRVDGRLRATVSP